jgi:hypothetical protein
MSGDTDGNKEFHEQLRLQQLYGQRQGDGVDPNTFVDPEDGTVYDWDHDKKAWFPKVCYLHVFCLAKTFYFCLQQLDVVIQGWATGGRMRPAFLKACRPISPLVLVHQQSFN